MVWVARVLKDRLVRHEGYAKAKYIYLLQQKNDGFFCQNPVFPLLNAGIHYSAGSKAA